MTPILKCAYSTARGAAGRLLILVLAAAWLWTCSFSSAVEKTSQTIKHTSRKITRGVNFKGGDLRHQVAVGGFETIAADKENSIRIYFDQGLPDQLVVVSGFFKLFPGLT